MNITTEERQAIVKLLQDTTRSTYDMGYRNGVKDTLDALNIEVREEDEHERSSETNC